jgi:predicted ATPase
MVLLRAGDEMLHALRILPMAQDRSIAVGVAEPGPAHTAFQHRRRPLESFGGRRVDGERNDHVKSTPLKTFGSEPSWFGAASSMRLAISGTHSMGKTTLLADCVNAFPDYTTESEAYRTLRRFNPAVHIGLGREADKHAMWILQGELMGKLLHHRKGDKVFFDRGPVDMLAYSLYAKEEHETDLDEGFLQSLQEIAGIYCREFLEAILFIPIRDDYAIQFENDGVRPTDEGYRERVDAHFKRIYKTLDLGIPIIEIQGSRASRILTIADYIRCEPAVLPPNEPTQP